MGILSLVRSVSTANSRARATAKAARTTVEANRSTILSKSVGGRSQARTATDRVSQTSPMVSRREVLDDAGTRATEAVAGKYIREQSGRATSKAIAPGVLASRRNLASAVAVQEAFALLSEDIKGAHEYALAFVVMLATDIRRVVAWAAGEDR